MFFISLPTTVRVGDTTDCKINGEPRKVTWRDTETLVIEPGDVRRIVSVMVNQGSDLRSFVCSDANGGNDFTIVTP
jgi:hypothetical protein